MSKPVEPMLTLKLTFSEAKLIALALDRIRQNNTNHVGLRFEAYELQLYIQGAMQDCLQRWTSPIVIWWHRLLGHKPSAKGLVLDTRA